MQASYSQSSFMSGEWSKAMEGRADHPEYRKAMSVCLNGVVIESEAWTRRPGFLQGGTTRLGQQGILRKFEFSEASFYNMEFTSGMVRFWSGLNIVPTNDTQVINSISAGTPAIVTTNLPHGWSSGNQVFFSALGVGAAILQNRFFAITVLSPSTFSLADALTNAPISGAGLNLLSGTVSRILELTTPYVGTTWASLRAIQVQTAQQLDAAVLLNGTTPQVISALTSPGPGIAANFAIAPINLIDGPYLDPYPGSQATPGGLQGNITFTLGFQNWSASVSYSAGDYVNQGGAFYKSLQNANLNNMPPNASFWKSVSAGDPIGPNGFVQSDVGRLIRMYSEPALWVATTNYAIGNIVAYSSNPLAPLYWTALKATTGVVPGSDATSWALASNVSLWTWGRITALQGGTQIIQGTGSPFGDMTSNGGLAAAFDNNTNQPIALCAAGPPTRFFNVKSATQTNFCGKNFSGNPQQIVQATAWPSNNAGFTNQLGPGPNWTSQVTLNLRAKQTAPANSSDGILLGTTGAVPDTAVPLSIGSSDNVTAWNFVWIEVIATWSSSVAQGLVLQPNVAEIEFFSPSASTGGVVTVQVAGPPLLYTTTIRTWRLGVYSQTTGWPTCGCYHEGRLWLGGAIPNRFDASQANSIFNFAPTQGDGTVTNANAISYSFNASDINTILWMAPRQEGIVCGTQAGEWLIQATAQNAPLTPTSIQAHRYTKIKCANIEPAEAEHTLVFVQKHRKRLMEYFADIFSGKFAAPNITYKSMHITQPGIAEIRYQHDQIPVVWMRMTDGSFAGVSYKRDSLMSRDGPSLAAVHRHTLGSGRTVTSMAVGPDGVGGELEALSVITTDGVFNYVEVMAQTFAEKDALSSAQFLDSSLIASSYIDNGTSCTFNGLWLLNGQTVEVFAGGLDCGAFPVANGSLTVPYGDGISAGAAQGQFTQAFVQSFATGAMPNLIGFTYLSQGQLLSPDNPQEAGTRQGPAFGAIKRSHRVKARFVNAITGAVSFGTDLTKTLFPANFKIKNGPVFTQQQLFSGVYKETLTDKGDPLESKLAWQVSGPFPCTIARLGASIDSEDE